MYFPAVGRFTSEDPKGFAAGDENLYRYVGNNPTNLTDPSGMDPPIRPGSIERWEWEQRNWASMRANSGSPADPSFLTILRGRQLEELALRLKPNWSSSTGRLYYHAAAMVIHGKCKTDEEVIELADTIYAGLKKFRHFNDGNLAQATQFSTTSGRSFAIFSLGFPVTLLPQGGDRLESFIDRFAMVRLSYQDKDRQVVAETLGNHVLVGVRYWRVTVSGKYIIVRTAAQDRRSGSLADKGFMRDNRGPDDTVKIWDTYLRNIVKAEIGDGWEVEYLPDISEFLESEPNTVESSFRKYYLPK
jgi:hypothetical protein